MSDSWGCVVDGVRRGIGGFSGTAPVPAGTCLHMEAYYCPGESYVIPSGPCEGECTCQGDSTFACKYLDPDVKGGCHVSQCVDGGDAWDVGTSGLLDDRCTVCSCTSEGMICDDRQCRRQERCAELEQEYEHALESMAACDPTSSTPQCTKRIPVDLTCDGTVPVNETWQTDEVAARFDVLACGAFPQPCMPVVVVGNRTVCTIEGFCRDVP